MKDLHKVVMVFFLIGLAGVVVFFNTTKQRLLIVQSYDKDYAWTRDVDIGIHRILDIKGDYFVRWFYMDTKRHPWEHYRINAGLAVQKLINNWQPSVVIAIDDDAQQFAMRFFNNSKNVQVIFAGVNNDAEDYGYDKANNVTGILERLPLSALKETLQEISKHWNLGHPVRILFLGDKSATVRGDAEFFSKFDWQPLQKQDSKLVETYAEWKDAVRSAADTTDFIIVSNYRQILRNKGETILVPPSELIAWTETNSRPLVIGTNVFYASDGGMLAIGTSPYEQGEVAATMAKDLLDHQDKPAKSIPIVITKQFVVSMRASRLRARNIKLPAIYEAAARSANNYYEGLTTTITAVSKTQPISATNPVVLTQPIVTTPSIAVTKPIATTITVLTPTTPPISSAQPVVPAVAILAPVATNAPIPTTKPITTKSPIPTTEPIVTLTPVVVVKHNPATHTPITKPKKVSKHKHRRYHKKAKKIHRK